MTTKEAAEYLRITPTMVARLCRQGKIYARKHGPVWDIHPESLMNFARKPRKVGRPRKTKPPDER